MTHLLDSDVIISHLNNKAHISLISSKPPSISIITYGEVLYGIKKSKRTETHAQFDAFLLATPIYILPINEMIIKKFIDLKIVLEQKGEKLQDFDLLIAATAIEHNLTLVTGNRKHFSRIPHLKLA